MLSAVFRRAMATAGGGGGGSTGPVAASITDKLTAALEPTFLQVDNESYKHSVPADSETHFKVTVVSSRFADVKAVERHRMVYAVLADEMAGGVHALSVKAKTPKQWEASGGAVHETPGCRGGSGK